MESQQYVDRFKFEGRIIEKKNHNCKIFDPVYRNSLKVKLAMNLFPTMKLQVLNNLALTHLTQKRYADALEFSTKALEISPSIFHFVN